MPDPGAVVDGLAARLPGWTIDWLAETGSTNTDLIAEARNGCPLPRLRGSHLQHAGRGRAERKFRTGPGDALMFSCALGTTLPVAALPTLSVLFGLVASETLAAQPGAAGRVHLKWPNDVCAGDAKLAGILMETVPARPGRTPAVVIGIGLNLRGGAALSEAFARPIADWTTATGQAAEPMALCAAVALAWREAVSHAEANWVPGAGLVDLPQRFARLDALAGRPVVVQDQGVALFEGTAAGVAADGRLRVDTGAGERLVIVGDVSVRAREPQAAS